MFKEVCIHYPTDENVLKQISKTIAVFRCVEIVKHIEMQRLSDNEIIKLFATIEEEIATRQKNRA